jgi:hypothetical protein
MRGTDTALPMYPETEASSLMRALMTCPGWMVRKKDRGRLRM